MVFEFKLPYTEETARYIDDNDFDQLTYSRRWKSYRISLKVPDLKLRREEIKYLIGEAFEFAKQNK